MKQEYHKTQRGQLHGEQEFEMTGLKNGTPYHDSDTFVVAPNRGILRRCSVANCS